MTKKEKKRMSGGFVAVIVFKWVKGIAFVIFGVAALRLSRASPMPSAVQIAKFLSVSKENELVRRVAEIMSTVTPGQAVGAGVASLAIAVVFFVEGILLAARVWWSTYLTIALTAMGIPLELYEIFHKPDSVRRYVLLAVNAAILLFLWTRRNEFRKPTLQTPERRAASG
ncbi:MAG: DUF2127 domain-containing protein [Acidobacteriota bacterium]